jgi:hypothetical protein
MRLPLSCLAFDAGKSVALRVCLLNSNTEILKHVAALEARILTREESIVGTMDNRPPG